MFIQFQTQV